MENNNVYCFTGVRDEEVKSELEKRGHRVVSGMSNKVTHLICKNFDSESSKFEKALDQGIEILTIDEIREELELN